MTRGKPKFHINRRSPPRILVLGVEIREFFGWSRDVFYRRWSVEKTFPFPMNYRDTPFRGKSAAEWKHVPAEVVAKWRANRPKGFRLYWDGREIAAYIRRNNGDKMAEIWCEQLHVQSDLDEDYQEQIRQARSGARIVGPKPRSDERPEMPPPPPLPPVKGAAT